MLKVKFNKITLAFLLLFLLLPFTGRAENYIAVAKEGKVYDEANAKYVTLNQKNEEVNVIPGMVFKTTEHVPGWYLVEYSPGLHAFIPDQIVATNFNSPQSGNFKIVNNPSQTLTVSGSGTDWEAQSGNSSFTGNRTEDIVVFKDMAGNQAFSLIDLGNGPIVVSYDNALTKFF